MAGRISGIGMQPQVPMPEADPAYWAQMQSEQELQQRKREMENAAAVYNQMQRELTTYGRTLDDPQGARLTANTATGLGPIAAQRKAAGDIAPGPQPGSGDRRRMAAGVSKMSKARMKVSSALHGVIDPANEAIDYYAGPHLGPALGRAAEGTNYVAGAMPGIGDAMQLGQAGADYVDAMGAGDTAGTWKAAGMAGMAMFVPMAAGGHGMTIADEAALREAERMWNEVPNSKRNFGLARDIWSKTGLTYVPGTDGRFVKEVADPTWKPGVKEQVIDKGVPFVGRHDQAFDAPEMYPYTPDVPGMPTYLKYDKDTVQGAYSPVAGGGSDMLAVGPEFRPGDDWGHGSLLEAAGHETGHGIFDTARGPDGNSLPGGASPKGVPSFVKKVQPDPMTGYRASTGEAFSHALMRRYGWTPEQRAARMPYDDMPLQPERGQWTRLLKKNPNGPGYVATYGWADPSVAGGLDVMETQLFDTIPTKSQVATMGEKWGGKTPEVERQGPPEMQGPPKPMQGPPTPTWRQRLGIGSVKKSASTDQLTDEMFLPQRGAKGEPDFSMFELAQKMEREGASPEDIWAATSQGGKPGIWRAPDGRWRWELDDSKAQLTPKGQHLAKSERNMRGDIPPEPLGTLWSHPGLYDAVPEGRGALARIVEDGGHSGSFDPRTKSVTAFGPRMVDPVFAEAERRAGFEPPKELNRVVGHEAQHLVSNTNDLPTGSMPGDGDHQYIRDYIASKGLMQPSDHMIYRASSDEVLARLADSRMHLPPETRSAFPPSAEMDVPAHQQWFRETDGSIWVRGKDGKRVDLVGPRPGWMDMADTPAGRSGDAGGLVDEMAATPVAGKKEKPLQTFPELATRYPEVAPGKPMVDPKTGKAYIGKDLSEEAKAFSKVRSKVLKDVAQRQYNPYFDPAKRQKVDPTNYPKQGDTLSTTMPKKPDTLAKYTNAARDPEAVKRLEAGFAEGNKFEGSRGWYWMKQLEDEYISELGEKEGRKQFEHWARSMAETTGGADPQTNFLAAHYLRWRRAQGLPAETKSTDMPYPVGGRFMSGNMEIANRQAGEPFNPATNPKRHNFEANFEGHPNPTIDEVMMSRGFDPNGDGVPPYYGPYEGAVNDLAAAHGIGAGSEYQDVAWAGLKRLAEQARGEEPYIPAPMIQTVNDSIERTARLTGMTPREVVRKNMIRLQGPMYGISGLMAADQIRRIIQQQDEKGGRNAY